MRLQQPGPLAPSWGRRGPSQEACAGSPLCRSANRCALDAKACALGRAHGYRTQSYVRPLRNRCCDVRRCARLPQAASRPPSCVAAPGCARSVQPHGRNVRGCMYEYSAQSPKAGAGSESVKRRGHANLLRFKLTVCASSLSHAHISSSHASYIRQQADTEVPLDVRTVDRRADCSCAS